MSRTERSSHRLYKQHQFIEARKKQKKEELDSKEIREIEEAKSERMKKHEANKKKWDLKNKPIY